MKRTALLIGAGCAALAAFAQTYTNPILTMDFSDPDVCAGPDGRFYMTASSFGGQPGLPVLVSDDLVNWAYVGYALTERNAGGYFEAGNPNHGNLVWAPSIRYRNGAFVIYWGDPDRGVYRVTAPDPSGDWSAPVLVKAGKGMIDPCPLYDDDGRIYLVHGWAQSRAGMNSVLTVSELNADETATRGGEVMVYDGVPEGNFTTEGPKFYKKDGAYWLLFPAGGVGGGWQVAARAESPYGPYEARTVMAQGQTKINGPHQGGWVRAADGSDWFVHFSDRDAYGRIVYLEPMTWGKGAWPVIGVDKDGDGCGEPVEEWTLPRTGLTGWESGLQGSAQANPVNQKGHPVNPVFSGVQTSDEFDAPRLGLQWQWLGRSAAQVGFPTTQGFFRLYTTPRVGRPQSSLALSGAANIWDTPNLLVQKFPAFAFTATMKAQVGAKQDGEEGGLIVQGLDYARLGLRSRGDAFEVVYTTCRAADQGKPERTTVLASVKADVIGAGLRTAKVKDVWLRVAVAPGAEVPPKRLAPDAVCAFSYSFDGATWTDAPAPFTAREGKWIGATVGLYAVSEPDCRDRGWLDADWFRVDRR